METTPYPKTPLRLIRALALIALLCSGYLLYQRLSGAYDDCCGHVLNSRWSHWFGIPVSAFAVAMYLVVIVASLPTFARTRPAAVAILLHGAAFLAAGAALWFLALMLFVENASCPYCIASHLCGLAIAVIVFTWARRSLPAAGPATYGVALIGLVALAAGQVLVKPPAPEIASLEPGGKTAQQSGMVEFAKGLSVRLDQFPTVGPAAPQHYLAELFDYTCASCRNMHGDLKALTAKYPETFAIIYLPCPLNRRCNMFLPPAVHDHEHACELAEVALAVWKADQAKFAEIHHYLMTTPLPIPPADAEAKAISLVGEAAYRRAAVLPAVKAALATSFGHYSLVARDNIRMPKLMLGEGKIMQSLANSPEAFVSLMAKHFGLDAPAPPPAR